MPGMLILGLLWPGGTHSCRSGAAPMVGSTDSPHPAEPAQLLPPAWTPTGAGGRSVTAAMAVAVPSSCELHQASPSGQGRNPRDPARSRDPCKDPSLAPNPSAEDLLSPPSRRRRL